MQEDSGREVGERRRRSHAPDGVMARRLGGSAARRLGGSAARRLGGSAARRLGGSAARRLGGSAARRLGGSAARRLGGSAARRLGGSAARRLGGSAARRLGGSAARRLGGSAARRTLYPPHPMRMSSAATTRRQCRRHRPRHRQPLRLPTHSAPPAARFRSSWSSSHRSDFRRLTARRACTHPGKSSHIPLSRTVMHARRRRKHRARDSRVRRVAPRVFVPARQPADDDGEAGIDLRTPVAIARGRDTTAALADSTTGNMSSRAFIAARRWTLPCAVPSGGCGAESCGTSVSMSPRIRASARENKSATASVVALSARVAAIIHATPNTARPAARKRHVIAGHE